MKLIKEWKRVLLISLSFWMQFIGILVLVVPEVMYLVTGTDYDPFLAWWAGLFLLTAGLVGRILQQGSSYAYEWFRITAVVILIFFLAGAFASKIHAEPVKEEDTLEIAIPFIAEAEGEHLVAYLDIVGKPTICYGHTHEVDLGLSMTRQQCLDLLHEQVAQHRKGLHAYFTEETINSRLTAKRDAAYTSLAFNAGVHAIGRSTATKRLNTGNISGGCAAIKWWNRAGGRIIRGLVSRRLREYELCMDGL